MFSGIIETTAPIIKKTETSLTIARPASFEDLIIGASIAVSGVCLSVTAFDDTTMSFDVVKETWKKSALGSLKAGDLVNLERAVLASSRLDGHVVQGHVEGVGTWRVGEGVWEVEVPNELIKFCVQKGSIALDGVSLTIAAVDGNIIRVALVPLTLEQTTLGSKQDQDPVNIETDILGRYLFAFTQQAAHVS